MVRWVGPFKITEALSHSFIIQHLISADEYEVHASRLKHYADSDFEVTEEIQNHIGLQGIILAVRAIVGHRRGHGRTWELCIAWRGLEDVENSWEPFHVIYKDVPRLVEAYVTENTSEDLGSLLAVSE